VCVEDLVEKIIKKTLFKVTEPSSVPSFALVWSVVIFCHLSKSKSLCATVLSRFSSLVRGEKSSETTCLGVQDTKLSTNKQHTLSH